MSLKIFCFHSMTLICNANKILLRGENLLQLQCKVMYLLRDVDLYFLQIIAEGLCTILYHREVCLVSTNVIEDNCSFQGFVVDLLFFFFGIIVGCETFAQKIWLSTLQAIITFKKNNNTCGTPFSHGRTKLFFVFVCTLFLWICKFTSQCALMYWGEGDVW